jgi:hypothetical protein
MCQQRTLLASRWNRLARRHHAAHSCDFDRPGTPCSVPVPFHEEVSGWESVLEPYRRASGHRKIKVIYSDVKED